MAAPQASPLSQEVFSIKSFGNSGKEQVGELSLRTLTQQYCVSEKEVTALALHQLEGNVPKCRK